MARYVDGFLVPVPKKNVAAYRRTAVKAARVWKKYGALEYVEARGDDMKPMGGGVALFPKLIKAKPNEVVFFSFIVYRSKADRDRINKKVMADPEIVREMERNEMPFDVKRMAMGGFRAVVDR